MNIIDMYTIMKNMNLKNPQDIEKVLYNNKSYPSICIPKINCSIKKNDIFDVIEKYHLGKINKIDLIKVGSYQKGFIHIKWNNETRSQSIRKLILTNNTFKVIYDYTNGWYWKCSASISEKNLPKIY